MRPRLVSLSILLSLVFIFIATASAATWATMYPPTGVGVGQVVLPSPDSGVVVAGDVNGHGYVAKISPSGQYLWQHTYGASVTSRFNAGCATSGGYLLTGAIMNGSFTDVWIMMISATGDSMWSRMYGGALADEAYGIQYLGTPGFVISGKKGVTGRGDDGYIIRCNNNGDTLWTRSLGGTGDDKFNSIEYDIWPAIEFTALGSKTVNSATDYWIARISDSSNVIWDSTYGGSYNDDGQDIIWTDNQNPILEGFNASFPPTGWTIINPDTGITWTRFSGTTSWARLRNSADTSHGQVDSLITLSISTVGLHSAEYLFNWSYAGGHTTNHNDGLEFAFTTNNGSTWTTLWYRHARDTLSLVAGTAATDTTPATSNYGVARVALPNSALNQASVKFAFIGHNDNGPDVFVTGNILTSCTYLTVGYSNSVTGSPNNKNLFLKKIDQLGRTIWDHNYGVAANEYGHRMLLNADRTFYVVGTSNSTDSQEGGSISLWKFSANGDSISQHTYGNTYNCLGQAMAITPNRDMYITGSAGSAANTRKLLLMKLDSTGALVSSMRVLPFTNNYFRVGDTTTFTWKENVPGVMRVELNRNYPTGAWTNLVSNTTVDSLRWVVTTPIAATCRIRATITGFADSITTVSDSAFAIVQPTVQVVFPNGGEMWPIGSTHIISWTSQYIRNERIIISLQRGTAQPTVLDTTSNPNTSMLWTVVGPTNNNCHIILTMIGGATTAVDQSDTNFAIVNQLHITHPTLNQAIQVGVNDTLRWISANLTDSIIVELKRNYPSGTWEVLGITDHNPGSFIWTPNLPLSPNTAIRISNYPNLTIRDTSGTFQILRPTITIQYPSNVEHFRPGSVQDLQWSSTNVTGFVRIQLNRHYPDSTRNWETLFDSTQNDGEQLWTVNGPSTIRARLRITSVFNPTVSDTSDNNFEIIDTTNAVAEGLPRVFRLGAYPNPFNSQIRIGYSLPHAMDVSIAIYDINGREMYRSEYRKLTGGYHAFDWNAAPYNLSSGIFYCRITGVDVSQIYKLVYLK